MLDYVKSCRPELSQRVRMGETGNPLPEQAMLLEAEARLRGIRTVNPPEPLSHTIKRIQAARWSGANISSMS